MDWQKTFFDTDGREQDSSTFDSSKRDELHCVKGKVYECNHRIKEFFILRKGKKHHWHTVAADLKSIFVSRNK